MMRKISLSVFTALIACSILEKTTQHSTHGTKNKSRESPPPNQMSGKAPRLVPQSIQTAGKCKEEQRLVWLTVSC